jgi:hypothetical protein
MSRGKSSRGKCARAHSVLIGHAAKRTEQQHALVEAVRQQQHALVEATCVEATVEQLP